MNYNFYKMNIFQAIFFITLLIDISKAYLPGIPGTQYCPKQAKIEGCKTSVRVLANSVISKKAMIPYKYGDLDACIDSDATVPSENLGQVLFGERFEVTNMSFEFNQPSSCKVACVKKYKPKSKKLEFLRRSIVLQYQNRMTVDDLPVIIPYQKINSAEEFYQTTIPVGCYTENHKDFCQLSITDKAPKTVYLFNHIDFIVQYHKTSPKYSYWPMSGNAETNRIVSVKAKVKSIDHAKDKPDCYGQKQLVLPEANEKDMDITYTYSVIFEENKDLVWSSRWDYLLKSMPHSNIQWLSIVNSVVIVLFLTGLVAFILVRTLRRDILRYNESDNNLESQEDFGWKLVHGDVFRSPGGGMLLSVFLGSGMQVLLMACCTLFFAFVAFSSPAYRGALLTSAVVTFVLLGSVAGYTSARIYKMIGGVRWKLNVILTATFCPGVIFFIFIIVNITLAVLKSSAAVSFSTIAALLALWLGVSLPLCFVGAFFGFRKPVITVPVRTNQIPRQIPTQSFYSRYGLTLLMSGSLPFGCIFVQLFIIFSSLWGTEIYYVFGFLFLVFIILIITSAETAILMCYFQLCAEDYRWWWKSFISVGASAVYVFLYGIHFFIFKLQAHDSTSFFLYFGYISIITWLFFLMTGTIGMLSCMWFVRKIYGVIKVD